MGFRFRKTIRILPGVRLNISKSGISTSIGGRGATVNLSRRGVRGTVGLPGSGLSYSDMLITAKPKRRSAKPPPAAVAPPVSHAPTPPEVPYAHLVPVAEGGLRRGRWIAVALVVLLVALALLF